MFSIDGFEWDLPCDITRTADMTASDISGLMLNRAYFNDVLGTYMKYDAKIVVPVGWEGNYSLLYEKLTEPVDGHTFVFPYNEGIITLTGRVEDVKDLYVKLGNGNVHWRGISFSVTSNYPTKQETLSGVIARGLAPMPDDPSPTEGTTYMYTGGGWLQLRNADVIQY